MGRLAPVPGTILVYLSRRFEVGDPEDLVNPSLRAA
jgi:hypothetical protein